MNRTRNSRPVLVAVRAPAIAARPILRKAAALAKLYEAPLRFVHVLPIPQSSLARASATIRAAAEADLEDRISQLKRLLDLAVLRGLPVSTAVRCDYPVQDALIREAFDCDARMLLMESNGHGRLTRLFLSNVDWELKKYGASVVVMGAVSRRGLKRVFIGNTAERVLDKLPCDVLVVKPRGFKSPVDRETYRDRIERPRRHLVTSRRRQSGGDITYVAH